jgi:hypothetical protein
MVKILLDKNYYEKFWVGLMDGDGSVQINHWRHKNLQFRFIIKLKYNIPNYNMLVVLSKSIGGSVRIVSDGQFVIWIENRQKKIGELLKIFKKYPPLTKRLTLQLLFFESCSNHKDINLYLKTRGLKYTSVQITEKSHLEFLKLSYFSEWLSGFVEAEGCFSRGLIASPSFSIAQKNEKELLLAIKKYFLIVSGVLYRKKDEIYVIQTYRKTTLENIFNHFLTYPLLGDKLESFNKFYRSK